MPALATIADVEAVSRPVPPGDVVRVTRLIDLVSAHVVRYTGQRFEEETETITAWPHDGVLRLPQQPVTTVAGVVMAGATLAPSTYTFTTNGYLYRAPAMTGWAVNGSDYWPGCGWPSVAFDINYTHGYPVGDYPDDVALVVAETVAGKWQSGASQASRLTSETIDGYAQTWATPGGDGDAWLPAHQQILDTYRRSGSVSVRLV